MLQRISVFAIATLSLALVSCGGPGDDEIREAVLMTGHATGAVVMQSVMADSEPYDGVSYDQATQLLEFNEFSTERFGLISPYTRIDGTVKLGEAEIERADVTLSDGPINEISFGYDEVAPLSGEWTVSGRADGRRFRVTITTEQLRAFRRRD